MRFLPTYFKEGGVALDPPLVVLMNEGSASVLQAHVQATLVGQTTSGTSTILNEFGLSDGSVLLLAT